MNKALLFTIALFYYLYSISQDYDYCECLEYYQKSKAKQQSFIELRTAYRSDQIKAITYSILNDTIFSLKADSIVTNKPLFIPNLSADNKFHNSPQVGFAMSKDTAAMTDVFTSYTDSFPGKFDSLQFTWSYRGFTFQDDDRVFYAMYAISTKNDAVHYLPESAIQYARLSVDPNNGEIGVAASMTDEGAERFEKMSSENVGEFLAILSENKVLSAPRINAPIPGGVIYVAGEFSKAEAKALIWLINCKKTKQRLGEQVFNEKMEDCMD